MRLILIAGASLAAVACAPTSSPLPEPGPESGPRQCDAATTGRELIGSHVGAVDFAPGANVRVVCTTCPTTRDYRPDRLNVRFDQATGIIKAVDCG